MRPSKDVLLQTKVTAEQEAVIRTAAERHSLTVAAYLRMTAMQFATMSEYRAWVSNYGEPPEVWLARDYRAHYMLRRLREGANGEQTFAMFMLTEHDDLVAVPGSAVAYGLEFVKKPERHQFVIDGSQDRWFQVSTKHNSALGLVELTLRPEGSSPIDAIRKRIHDARDGELVYTINGGGELHGRVDILGIGTASCELRLAAGGKVTLPYANVIAVGSPP